MYPSDVNECRDGSFLCHEDAGCLNMIGSYYCICSPPFYGDGKSCEGTLSCSLLTYHTYFFLTNCLTSHVILLLTGTYHTYFVLMNFLTQSESIVLVPHCTGCVVIGENFYIVKIYSFGIRAIKFRRVHFESKSYFIKKGIYSW